MQKIKDFIYYNRREIVTIFICLSLFVSYIIFNKNEDYIVEEKQIINEEKNEEEKKIIVDIKGEVAKPGTYELIEEERIIDVINKSGGLTEKANVNSINLSEKVKDEMLIIIPSIEEKTNIEIKNDANVQKEIDDKISINTASVSELMKLNGIGKTKAESIVDYRNKNGLFKSIKDITKVSGIGNSTYEKIKDYIKV